MEILVLPALKFEKFLELHKTVSFWNEKFSSYKKYYFTVIFVT